MGRHTETWCKGYKYPGGFEYRCNADGTLTVINVVDIEDYVKGVVPYEMDKDWPLAALEAQGGLRPHLCRKDPASLFGL